MTPDRFPPVVIPSGARNLLPSLRCKTATERSRSAYTKPIVAILLNYRKVPRWSTRGSGRIAWTKPAHPSTRLGDCEGESRRKDRDSFVFWGRFVAAKKQASVAKKKRKSAKRMLGTCFVLMPFREPFDTYYLSIIKPAVHAARLAAVRGDSLFRPSPIMADIWQMTQDAKVLVAELTEKNANVFYELGLAHAIGKPVVLIADNLTDIPFDLQSLRVIIYDKNDPAWGTELKASITESLVSCN